MGTSLPDEFSPWWSIPVLGTLVAVLFIPAVVIWEMMQPDTPGGGSPGEGSPHPKGNPRNKEEAIKEIEAAIQDELQAVKMYAHLGLELPRFISQDKALKVSNIMLDEERHKGILEEVLMALKENPENPGSAEYKALKENPGEESWTVMSVKTGIGVRELPTFKAAEEWIKKNIKKEEWDLYYITKPSAPEEFFYKVKDNPDHVARIDAKFESKREEKRSEWRAKGYPEGLIDRALSWAEEYSISMAAKITDDPSLRYRIEQELYPRALDMSGNWVEGITKAIYG
jgi:rubrerythrin